MNRKPVYLAAHPVEAEIVRGYLAAHGIATTAHGAYAWSGRGELPADIYPRLYLEDERDWDRARALIREYERRDAARATWRCTGCGEENEEQFAVCWNCQRPREP